VVVWEGLEGMINMIMIVIVVRVFVFNLERVPPLFVTLKFGRYGLAFG
jgi:hypothetical protein